MMKELYIQENYSKDQLPAGAPLPTSQWEDKIEEILDKNAEVILVDKSGNPNLDD